MPTVIEGFHKDFLESFIFTSKLMLNLAELPALTTTKLLILASVNLGLTMGKSK